MVDQCNHAATLRPFWLRIEHISAFSVKGRVFAWSVYGNCGFFEGRWLGAGCDTGVLLTDTTGNGKFDYLQIGVWAPRQLPEWVGAAGH